MSNTFFAQNVKLNATMLMQRKKTVEAFHTYSKWQAGKHLKEFQQGNCVRECVNPCKYRKVLPNTEQLAVGIRLRAETPLAIPIRHL